jgi:hypothetical protein
VESDSINPDPDLAFQVNPDPDPIRIQGFDHQKLKKKTQLKISVFLHLSLITNYNLLIPRPSYRTSKLQEKPSATKREQPGSRDHIESGSNPDPGTPLNPDSQQCRKPMAAGMQANHSPTPNLFPLLLTGH